MKKNLNFPVFFSLMFGCILFSCGFAPAQNRGIDSLKTLLKKDKNDTNKVIHLYKLCGAYNAIGNYDSALACGNASMKLASSIADAQSNHLDPIYVAAQKGMANAFNNLAIIYVEQGDYSNALGYYSKALAIDKEFGNKSGMGMRLGNIGLVYWNKGDFPMAIDFYFQAQKIYEELGAKIDMAINLSNIGLVYWNQGDLPKALDYFFKALPAARENGMKELEANLLCNIGNIHDEQKNYPQALEYYFKSLKIEEELGNESGIAALYGNIGIVYVNQDDFSTALDYYFKALTMDEKLGDRNASAVWLGDIGLVYTLQKKYQEAYDFLYRALALADSIGAMNLAKEHYQKLSSLYEISNVPLPDSIGGKLLNMEQMRLRSLYYFKSYINLRDTLFSEENKKQLVRKEMNFEFEKKEAATKAENDKKEALAKEELKQKENERNYFIAGFALVLLLAGFIFRSYRQKQKANEIISKQKLVVEEKQKEILDSIHYAKRIQQSLLPTEKYIEKNLKVVNQ